MALFALLAGCGGGTSGQPRPRAEQLSAEVLSFDPGGWAPRRVAALSDAPIHLGAFLSWYGGADPDAEAPEVTAEPDTTYLAATDSTGCRAPETVQVWRTGTDLQVRFVGGADHEECVRAVGPVAYLAVPARQVRGVRTIGGDLPADAAGPGRLTDFVPLGTVRLDPAAAELGDTAALRDRLAAAGADPGPALDRPVPAGSRGFAFVLAGCADTAAVLLLGDGRITADLTGGEGTNCDAAEYYLATFDVDAELVPDGAVPVR
ncbi:MAG: hypothetical protein GEV28_04140 [Actinophytocola sp.]|uniref:hypothetical protein n=1 Tax=Actinophytocola sp. TaxID=1872138 RepID=UPI00132A2EAA|nr:hypothetical protein [Actinophytocola sp.]MPZ79619.1 hypothetical protein [Actinophytocola sp.]